MHKLHIVLASMATCGLVSGVEAQPAEPLVWTTFEDPDPNFIPPPEPRSRERAVKARKRQPAAAPREQAAYEAGRSLAAAAMAIEAAACKRIKDAPLEQVPLWARKCPR